jgi:hypothetical protein
MALREQRLLAAEVVASMYPNQQQVGTSGPSTSMLDFPQLQGLSKSMPPNMLLNLWNTDTDVKLMEQMLMQQKLPGAAGLFSGQGDLGSMGLDGGLLGQQQLQQQQQLHLQPQQLAFQFGAMNGGTFTTALAQQQAQLQAQQQQQQQQQQSSELPSVLVQEFEFANLEFLKPTRMNKVYMVFACNIMDLDTLFVVFNVPTVGICRAEQREKACQKLGVPMPLIQADFSSPTGVVKTEPGTTGEPSQQPGAHVSGAPLVRKRDAAQVGEYDCTARMAASMRLVAHLASVLLTGWCLPASSVFFIVRCNSVF